MQWRMATVSGAMALSAIEPLSVQPLNADARTYGGSAEDSDRL